MAHDARLSAYGAAATSLALHSDRALRELVDAATPVGVGIGGRTARLEIDGTPVFVKRVPLTAPELAPDAVHSTANLFDLPLSCHYGIGRSPGFGAWRELAVHTMTTNWALAGESGGFPLMYHWRVLPDAAPLPDELADVERTVAYWDGAPQVRRRLEALRHAPASLTLFLEYIPRNLFQWLAEQTDAGGATAERACAMVERELAAGLSFMNSRGLLHFDAHFQNVLTDGGRLYFADYGLAISSRFDLSPDELAFFHRHASYDRAYSVTYMVNWLLKDLYGYEKDDREAWLRQPARGGHPTGIPAAAASALTRHAPVTAVMNGFFGALAEESGTPYPAAEIHRAGGGPV